MKKILLFLVLFVFVAGSTLNAGTIFVATAKNLRGALYMGYGPSPQGASEQAVSKCSQDSFIPCSCQVINVRCEYVPDKPIAMAPPIHKVPPRGLRTFQ